MKTHPHELALIADQCVRFITKVYKNARKKKAVIAVSGGIDSAVSVSLATKSLRPEHIIPVLLPYGSQDMADAKRILRWNNIEETQWQEIDIEPLVSSVAKMRKIEQTDRLRLGNVMARVRMILVYDLAKENNALVCGTENKSEKYLAYFTRFGDEASDLEPIQDLFKTEVQALAAFLNIPRSILEKAPSAGLWQGQSDEQELGFTYKEADMVLEQYQKYEKAVSENTVDTTSSNLYGIPQLVQSIAQQVSVSEQTITAVITRLKINAFKHKVPYELIFR